MLGGPRFKVIRESDELWCVGRNLPMDLEVHAIKDGGDLIVSREVYAAIEAAVKRGAKAE